MKVAVVGTGYVGLVTGTCFAEKGNDVVCVDINRQKVAAMQAGTVPIYEPGLGELFRHNIAEERLHFTTDLKEAMGASVIFLALPTPPEEDGSADLSYILQAAGDIGKLLTTYTVIVNKSTVPVGTAELVRQKIAENASVEFDVVSNPEFLREGQAIEDFMYPDRVVIGAASERAANVMARLYRQFVTSDPNRIQLTDPATSELIKYAANGFLAAKITFINELSRYAEAVGADIDGVRRGMGADSRIGREFLWPGPGYGGSCFPKDTLALAKMGSKAGIPLGIINATIEANERQKLVIPEKVLAYYGGDVKGKTFALWGLAFKDKTDDIRESPALVMADALTAKGAVIVAFDPQARKNVEQARAGNKNLRYADDEYQAIAGADALIIATNWDEFRTPDFGRIKASMKAPVIFDGRNMYSLGDMADSGFYYESIGRKVVALRKKGA